MMASLPEGLFEHLLAERRYTGLKLSTKSLAQISVALRTGNNVAEVERCPHCHGVLRVRSQVGDKLADVVNKWLASGAVP
jgi:hypothetical protein